MRITDEVKRLFEKTALVAFATADEKGSPNVVPVFWKKILNDGTILLIDNFMKTTKQNLLENRRVCMSFWDPETEEAYKIKGFATYHAAGGIYEEGKKFMQAKKPGRIPKGVVEVEVKKVFTIKPGPDAGKKITA